MTEQRMQHALAQHFNYFQQCVAPNVYIGGGEMDLAIVTKTSFLIEVEIKLSVADWNADRAKAKWSPENAKYRECVSRFYYAVPTELIDKVPSWVPEHVGLLEVQWSEIRKRAWVVERRPAVKVGKVKLTDADRLILLKSTYYRFWQRELRATA